MIIYNKWVLINYLYSRFFTWIINTLVITAGVLNNIAFNKDVKIYGNDLLLNDKLKTK